MALGLLFPGQGSQAVGMGKALAEAHPGAAAVFAEADDLLGVPLSRVMWEGPEAELVRTENAQPAILVHSVAVLRVVEDLPGPVAAAAGHSLGEFSAHVAAGTISFADAVRSVRLRGELMGRAGAERPGAMAAVLGMEDEAVETLCAEISRETGLVLVPANFNSAGQVVVSGDAGAVARAVESGPSRGARKVIPLKVSGAFHSPLMAPAERGLRERLEGVNFGRPRFPVHSNVTTDPVRDGDQARDLLVRQLTSPVRWAGSVSRMVQDGIDRFLEVGPGEVLTGLCKRIAKGVPAAAVHGPEDLEGGDA